MQNSARHKKKKPDIDFSSIRPHHGTCHGGFEELIVSLFRHEYDSTLEIIRINGAGGDGGVEAYIELPEGEVAGVQAKFFPKLGSSQFKQIKKSIETAQKNYPKLTTYIVATRLDRTSSQIKQWNFLKSSIKQLNLIWWGESELIELLTRPEHAGRLTYWFGATDFGQDWVKSHNQRACNDLDTRYSPDNHVRVQTQDHLDAIAQTSEFIREYYGLAKRVWRAWKLSVAFHESEKTSTAFFNVVEHARKIGDKELLRLGNGERLPSWSEVVEVVNHLQAENQTVTKECVSLLKQLNESNKEITKEKTDQYRSSLEARRQDLVESYQQLQSLIHHVEQYSWGGSNCLLLTGDAGTGKSHLLANFVKELEKREQIVLFLLGEYFTSGAEPWSQLTARLGWNDGEEALLAALNYAGEISGRPAFLIIDALNESRERYVWQNHLAGFAERLMKWPWLRLIVSCRTDFLPLTIPSRIHEGKETGWKHVEHQGFGLVTFDAVTRYFESFRVKARDYPPLLPEFRNPLFLKTFAEAFSGREIPSGPLSLDHVMRQRIRVACEQIQKAIDCPFDATEGALEWLAQEIEKEGWQSIPLAEARKGINAFFPSTGQSRSLYHHLKSSGLLVELGNYDCESRSEINVRFAYERFSDYFVAQRVLKNIDSTDELKHQWKSRGYDGWGNQSEYYHNRGLLRALAILIPERFEIELVDLLDGDEVHKEAVEDFLISLPWRSAESISGRSFEILKESKAIVSLNDIFVTLLELSSIPGHPWNANFLHSRLKSMSLADRDCKWTIGVSEMIDHEESIPELILKWLYLINTERISDEQALLIGTMLMWFFSSNNRGFRKRAIIATTKLLIGKTKVAASLVSNFYDVNDAYVTEGVYAVAAGVAARENIPIKLAPLAEAVWQTVFKPSLIKTHILLRHYAYMVMERAFKLGVLPSGIKSNAYRPPYHSNWPEIWGEEESRTWDSKEGWGIIIRSIEPEYGKGIGGYGDFGRYVMQEHVHKWSNIRLRDPYPEDDKGRVFNENLARCWILQYIIKVGWTPEKFLEYEKKLPQGRQSLNIEEIKVERISKKYQWIALFEFEALLADHFHLFHWNKERELVFEGVWQVYSSYFDPIQPLEDPRLEDAEDDVYRKRISSNEKSVPAWVNYPNPFQDKDLTNNRSAWVRCIPDDFGQLLQVPNAPGLSADALLLSFWQSWEEPDSFPPRDINDGRAHMYIHARAWIVPQKCCATWLQFLRETHFWGDGVMLPELGTSDLNEYPWSERFKDFRERCKNEDHFGRKFPSGLSYAACRYGSMACVPSPQMAELLQAQWNGKGFDFVNDKGVIVCTSPYSKNNDYCPPCMARRSVLVESLKKQNMTVLWGIVGEKYCYDYDSHCHVGNAHVEFSGVYYLDSNSTIKGGLTMRNIIEIPKGNSLNHEPYPRSMELLSFGTKLPLAD